LVLTTISTPERLKKKIKRKLEPRIRVKIKKNTLIFV